MPEELLQERTKVVVAAWPGPQDYNEAVQNPGQSFLDPELAGGEPETNRLGLPKPTSGMFASVYKMHCAESVWAVRCFLQSKQDQAERYRQIEKVLRSASIDCLVPFQFQEDGIRVDNRILPMLKMQWCEGESLNRWLQRNLRNKEGLENFLESFRETTKKLTDAGIAHGDLQHGNIMIVEDKIKLVDYDCVYIPQFQGKSSNEIGHPNYQHPSRSHLHFGPYLDNFSAWLIYLSVLISGCDPHVWFDFGGGDECLLFRKDDLDNPMQSELFHVLEHHFNPQIREASRTLRYLLTLPPDQIPGLDAPITVPEDLPELDAVISDLPDWVASHTSPTPGIPNLTLPELPAGKRFLKRRRKRGVPLPKELTEGSEDGCWSYDENGLAFNPQAQAGSSASSSTSQTMLSPIVHEAAKPVPYRRVGGMLTSPMLDGFAENYDKSGNASSFSELLKFLPLLAVFSVFGCIYLAYWFPSYFDARTWPDGEYYRLDEGFRAEGQNSANEAANVFSKGIEEIKDSKDPRAALSLIHLYHNLGRVQNNNWRYRSSIENQKEAIRRMQLLDGGTSSPEYGVMLEELARAYETAQRFPEAAKCYKLAVTAMQESALTTDDEELRNTIESLVKILKRLGSTEEAAQYDALINPPADTGDGTTMSQEEAKKELEQRKLRVKPPKKPKTAHAK